jgi:hypothetical protein
MTSRHIQNGHNAFIMLFSIHCICGYNYMIHANQSWCIFLCDSIDLIVLRSKVKGIGS